MKTCERGEQVKALLLCAYVARMAGICCRSQLPVRGPAVGGFSWRGAVGCRVLVLRIIFPG